ncbi:B3/4 domain-containing protein [uncultured Aquitalea sp.]|uniref:B3/B4 domain-containing protein n=1 Tax=uncultured Aquitalea sp. TaxID=540272 RepID=UPI0025EE5019|nr:B3/4 domain-containing protein [uncultured Aquitalea sp.]
MPPLHPSIDPAVAAIAPGFRALSIYVEAAPLQHPGLAAEALREACRHVEAGGAPWAEAHLQAWAEVFRGFGAKPQRTPCSAEALRKRVLRDGALPAIDPVVDLYNAVSLRYAIPVGGENAAAYVGTPRLTVADGSELFDTMKEGVPANESPDVGEVVWRDDIGVTCRRWNWRQGVRTRLDARAERMWFILESLPAMPLPALQEAGAMLAEGLQAMMPGAVVHSELISLSATREAR